MSSHTCRRPNSEGASLSLAAYSSDTCTANTGLKDEWDAGLLGAQQLIKRGFTVSASATLGAVGSIVCKLHASGEYTGARTAALAALMLTVKKANEMSWSLGWKAKGKKGVQKPAALEASPTIGLEAKVGAGAYAAASLTVGATATSEEAIEVNTVIWR
jgi:hypothetical protein